MIEGSLVKFGTNLCWYVLKKEGDLITLALKQGFSLSEIIKNNKELYNLENIDEDSYTQTIFLNEHKANKYVNAFLNGEFINRFSINEKKSMIPFSKRTKELAKILDEDEFRTYLLPALNRIYFNELSKKIGLSSNNEEYFMLNNGTYYDAFYKEVREIRSVEIELKKYRSSLFSSIDLLRSCESGLPLPAEKIKIHPIIKISLGYKES